MISFAARFLFDAYNRLPYFRGKWRISSIILRFTTYAKSIYGPYIVVDTSDYTNSACLRGDYGYELKNLIEALPEDANFLDFGANLGIYSLIADRHLKTGRIFAFEPAANTFAKLVKNIELNKARQVVALNFGVALESGILQFSQPAGHTGGAHISEHGDEKIVLIAISAIKPILNIDDKKATLCKIDTEGSEFLILTALHEAGILRSIDQFYIEIDRKNLERMNSSPEAIYEFLSIQGYEPITNRRGHEHYDEIFKINRQNPEELSNSVS